MLTGKSVLESFEFILASAITVSFTFTGNYLLLFPQRVFQPFLTKIFTNFNRGSFRSDIVQQDWTCNGSDDPNFL